MYKKIISILFYLVFISNVLAAAPTRTYDYTSGDTIDPDQVDTNENNLYNYLIGGVDTISDGTIVNADLSSSAAIADSKLAQITTASKVSGTALTSLASIPSGAGSIPTANLPTLTYFKIGSTTRDTSVASGTQEVTGIGFAPTAVIFFITEPGNANEISWGFDTVSTQVVLGSNTAASGGYTTSTSYSIYDLENGAGTSYSGEISATSSDSFTITWTKAGSPTGTITIEYIAFK